MAEAAIADTGMEHVFLRPSWIYGPRDRSMNRFVFFCRHLPVVPVIGNGQTPVFPIYVKDVARCVVESARREDATARKLDLGGPQRMTMDEVIRTIQDVLGRRRPLLHHPVGLMKLLVLPMKVMPEPMLRSEEHTSELQSRPHLVCRLLLEKKKNHQSRRSILVLLWDLRHASSRKILLVR